MYYIFYFYFFPHFQLNLSVRTAFKKKLLEIDKWKVSHPFWRKTKENSYNIAIRISKVISALKRKTKKKEKKEKGFGILSDMLGAVGREGKKLFKF